jgi:hypothetical protein
MKDIICILRAKGVVRLVDESSNGTWTRFYHVIKIKREPCFENRDEGTVSVLGTIDKTRAAASMDVEGSLQRLVQGEHETHSHQKRRDIDSDITPSLPAFARTMSILELRQEIFQLVDRDLSRKKTLLALAVTCKSFTEPALDLLWRELDLFSPLIRCLPPSLWKLDKLELVSKVLTSAREYTNLPPTAISKGHDIGRLVHLLQVQPSRPFTPHETVALWGQYRNFDCPWIPSLLPSIASQPNVSYLGCG